METTLQIVKIKADSNEQRLSSTFRLDAVEVRQLRSSVDGFAALKAAHHRVHQQGVGQSLLHVLGVLEEQSQLLLTPCGSGMTEQIHIYNI